MSAADAGAAASKREDLYERYPADALRRGEQIYGEGFLRTVSLNDALDPEWTEAWLTFVYDRMFGRSVLDERTRMLVLIGQYIAGKMYDHLQHQMKAAIEAGVAPQEILEVCLQAPLYVGMPSLRHSLAAYRAVLTELGVESFPEPPFRYFRTGDSR